MVYAFTRNKILTVALCVLQAMAFVGLFCQNAMEYFGAKSYTGTDITPALLKEYAISGKELRIKATLAQPLTAMFYQATYTSGLHGGHSVTKIRYYPEFLEVKANGNSLWVDTHRLLIDQPTDENKRNPNRSHIKQDFMVLPIGAQVTFLGNITEDPATHKFILKKDFRQYDSYQVRAYPEEK